jgi:hypothetical protein
MGQVVMTDLTLQEAVERTGTSKVDIWRAIQAGALSAKKTDDGGFAIDPSDLFAVFETKQVDQCSMAEDAGPSVEVQNLPERTQCLKRPQRPTPPSRSRPLERRSAFSRCPPRRQRVTDCVRIGMRGLRSS